MSTPGIYPIAFISRDPNAPGEPGSANSTIASPNVSDTQRDDMRIATLARRGARMSRSERGELWRLLAKLGPGEFAVATANGFSPVRVPRRLGGGAKR